MGPKAKVVAQKGGDVMIGQIGVVSPLAIIFGWD